VENKWILLLPALHNLAESTGQCGNESLFQCSLHYSLYILKKVARIVEKILIKK